MKLQYKVRFHISATRAQTERVFDAARLHGFALGELLALVQRRALPVALAALAAYVRRLGGAQRGGAIVAL